MQSVLRPILMLLAIFVVGPVAGLLTGALSSPTGAYASTLLVSSHPVMGLLAGLAAVVMAAALGVVSARYVDVRAGFFNAGVVLCWAAWRLGPIGDVLRDIDAGSRLTTMALEGAVFGVAVLIAAGLILSAGHDDPGEREEEGIGPIDPKGVRNILAAGSGVPSFVGMLIGAAAALAAGGLIARSGMAGQSVFAGIGAGVAAAAVGRLVSASLGRDAAVTVFVASCVVAAAAGPVIELAMAGGTPIEAKVIAGDLLGVGRVSALAWMGGAMIGAPWGARWFHSSIERQLSHA